MEKWETAPIETLTPKQQRQRRIRDKEKELTAVLGITEFSNFGRLSDWKGIEALATEDASVEKIVAAVYWIDRDGGTDIANYSNAAVNTDRLRLFLESNPRLDGTTAMRRAKRLEGEALEAMLEGSPRTVVRRMLLHRLQEMGVKLPNDHLHVCRFLFEAFQSRKAVRGRPGLEQELERYEKTIADYIN